MSGFRSFGAAIASGVSLAALTVGGVDAAQRTFVASGGSDSNNCSISAPCRSFGVALTHTDDAGEIVVLDSAGYGRVTIGQSVSIIAPPGLYAGISVFAGENGIDVAGAAIVVKLRGLTINGQGGDIGISFSQGTRLYVEHCVISDMSSRGIRVQTGETYVTDSTIRGNGGNGIRAESQSKLTVDRTRIERHVVGVYATNGPNVTITNSILAGNNNGVDLINDDGASETIATVTNSSLSQNASGVTANSFGSGSTVRLFVEHNTISANGFTGVYMDSGSTGTLVAAVTDNTIGRNNRGIEAMGAGLAVTLATNTVVANTSSGIRQINSSLVRTRANNIVQDNGTDIVGTLTFVSGD